VLSCGLGENFLASPQDLLGPAVMDIRRRQVGDAAVTVLVVVPVDERRAPILRVLQRAEAVGEVGPVLLRLDSEILRRDGAEVVLRYRRAAETAEVRLRLRRLV
jgi:hypothetical protein